MNFYRVVEITTTNIKSYKLAKISLKSGYHLELTFHKQFIKDLLTTFKNLHWELENELYIFVFVGEFPALVKARLKIEIAELLGSHSVCFDFEKHFAQVQILRKATGINEISVLVQNRRLLFYYQSPKRELSKFFAVKIDDADDFSAFIADYLSKLNINDGLSKIRFLDFDEHYDEVLQIMVVFERYFPYARIIFDERDLVTLAFR